MCIKTKENSTHNLPSKVPNPHPTKKNKFPLETFSIRKFTMTKFFYYSLTFQIISIQIICNIFNLSKNKTHSYIKTNEESNSSTSVLQSPKKTNFPSHIPIQKFTHLIASINHLTENQTRPFIIPIEELNFIPTMFSIQNPLQKINQLFPQTQSSTKSSLCLNFLIVNLFK